MEKIGVLSLIALGIAVSACGGKDTTVIRRETVQTVPAAPAIVEKRTTIAPAAAVVERRTTIESAPGFEKQTTTVETVPAAPAVIEKQTIVHPAAPVVEHRTETIETDD